MKHKNIGIIYAFIALFSWGIHGPAGRYLALQNVDMNFVFTFRIWVGALTFFLYLLFKKALVFNLNERWQLLTGIVLIGIIANSLLYHQALKYLPGTLVMILENLAPVFVLLMSFYFNKIRTTKNEILTLLLSFSGIILIVVGKNAFTGLQEHFYWGVILGILTGFTFGFYIYYSGELVRPYKDNPLKIIQFLFKIFLISGIITCPFLFTSRNLPNSPNEWFWLWEMGIFQSGLSYLFWNYALAHIKANTASILFISTIIFTTINEILFLNLKLNIYLILGGLLICLSGYLISRESLQKS